MKVARLRGLQVEKSDAVCFISGYGRVVEGAGLQNQMRETEHVGSNPTAPANKNTCR